MAERYGAGPLDEHLVALLPLKTGGAMSLATYGPAGGTPGGFIAAEPLQPGSIS